MIEFKKYAILKSLANYEITSPARGGVRGRVSFLLSTISVSYDPQPR